jgi:Kef-type K+ transport system membrane component KefB
MDLPEGLDSLFVIVLIAAIVPLIVSLVPGQRVPEVVLLLVCGVVVGPHVLDLAQTDQAILLISNVGLGFLFFVAGYELDLSVLRGAEGVAAGLAWALSMLVALAVVGVLAASGFVHAFLPVAIALTTTALGMLLPILRDAGATGGTLGRAMLANGAVGEFAPIVAISVFLSARGAWESLALLLAFGLIALLLSSGTGWLKDRRVADLVERGSESSSQTPVRITMLLLVSLLVLAGELGLDVVLGAFAAGFVLRVTLPRGDERLERKLDGLAFGFFIPAFFVVSGMQVDVQSIIDNPARLAVFFVLLLAVRGLSVFLVFRSRLPGREPFQLALFAATGLPVIVAITQIGLSTGVMLPENAAALVGAGLLSVLVFPMLGVAIGERHDAEPGPDPLPTGPQPSPPGMDRPPGA